MPSPAKLTYKEILLSSAIMSVIGSSKPKPAAKRTSPSNQEVITIDSSEEDSEQSNPAKRTRRTKAVLGPSNHGNFSGHSKKELDSSDEEVIDLDSSDEDSDDDYDPPDHGNFSGRAMGKENRENHSSSKQVATKRNSKPAAKRNSKPAAKRSSSNEFLPDVEDLKKLVSSFQTNEKPPSLQASLQAAIDKLRGWRYATPPSSDHADKTYARGNLVNYFIELMGTLDPSTPFAIRSILCGKMQKPT